MVWAPGRWGWRRYKHRFGRVPLYDAAGGSAGTSYDGFPSRAWVGWIVAFDVDIVDHQLSDDWFSGYCLAELCQEDDACDEQLMEKHFGDEGQVMVGVRDETNFESDQST